uniref:SUPPRESSOR OF OVEREXPRESSION OF CONSTANS1 n=1 Tax=Litchi chinensis TaxID=151069 RepID=A0A7G9INL3_LITCN|nr:SUPPRESSOR OF OVEREXPRESSION OF CONSTANS1 [Litchi chinensis]
MVRGKTQMRRIENATSRQVTFSKRRNGLLKKAFELSVLCDAEVALIIFSPRGKLYEFANSSMQETIQRYLKHTKDTRTIDKPTEQSMQQMKNEAANMMKKIELLEVAKRRLLGEGLGSCSIDELQQIEQQLERSVTCIRARKSQVFKEQIELLKEKENNLIAENARLSAKCGVQPWLGSKEKEKEKEQPENSPSNEDSTPTSDVETELFIGLPPARRTRHLPRPPPPQPN